MAHTAVSFGYLLPTREVVMAQETPDFRLILTLARVQGLYAGTAERCATWLNDFIAAGAQTIVLRGFGIGTVMTTASFAVVPAVCVGQAGLVARLRTLVRHTGAAARFCHAGALKSIIDLVVPVDYTTYDCVKGDVRMQFDLVQTDALLSTTRAVRRRLDLDRDVPDDVLLRCIDLAEQAPSGGNITSRRWLVIRDPDTKARLAELYREAGGKGLIESAARLSAAGRPGARVLASAAHLAENLERVPALVLVTVWGTHDGSGRPGLFDSVLQAAWSFCLALRARGLGSAWTTIHLGRANEVAELVGIPSGVTQVVLLPVAWTIGTDFTPAARRPASEITWFDRWGYTNERPYDGQSLLAAGPGVTVEVDVAAPPARVWELVSDINVPAQFSIEFQGAEWTAAAGPRVGASFVGRNARDGREWQTTSFVVACDPPRVFAWNVSDPDRPGAQWRFELEPLGEGTRLRQHMTIGPGRSGTSGRIEAHPDQAQQILAQRRDQLRYNMELTTQGIKRLAESGS